MDDKADRGVWKRWGAELQRLREEADWTQRRLSKEVGLAHSTLSSFENAIRTPRKSHAQRLDTMLNAGGALVTLWEEVAGTNSIPEGWREYEKIEKQAVEIREFHNSVIPGLLQTPQYAEAMIRNTSKFEESGLEKLVSSRVSRINTVKEAELSFVLDEYCVRRVIGGEEILCEQLERIQSLVESRRIRLGIIPFRSPFHPSPTASFRLMSLGDGRMVGHEGHLTGVHVTTGVEAMRLSRIFGSLQSEALPSGMTIELLEKIRQENSNG